MKIFKFSFLLLISGFILTFVFLFNLNTINASNNENEFEVDYDLFECTIPCGLPTEMIRIPLGGRFGDPRRYRDGDHIGLDISNDCGEPIWTQADGIVKNVDYDLSRGHYVVIDHGRYETWYTHFQEVFVKKGLLVEKKEIIGTVGDTGIAEGCHLHYEIWKDGEPVDPEPFVNARVKSGDPVPPYNYARKSAWECESIQAILESRTCLDKEIRNIPEERIKDFDKEKGIGEVEVPEEYKISKEIDIKKDLHEKINLLDGMIAQLELSSDDSIAELFRKIRGDDSEIHFAKFEKNIGTGDTGESVRNLQIKLNELGYTVSKSGPGSPGNETNYFGPLTKNAVIKFQEANASKILHPLGLTSGTGYVGPSTRNLLNSL